MCLVAAVSHAAAVPQQQRMYILSEHTFYTPSHCALRQKF